MSNAKSLIEARVAAKIQENGDMPLEYKYVCLDTGLYFEAENDGAVYSPYTGGMNVSLQGLEAPHDDAPDMPLEVPYEGVNPNEYMKPTGLPGNQSNMSKQNPLKGNPAPGQSDPLKGNSPLKPNPAPDSPGRMNPQTTAGSKGYV